VAGQRSFGTGLLEGRQGGPYRVQVDQRVDGQQAPLVQLDPGAQVPEGLAVDDHADIDRFAAFDAGHHPDQRVLEDPGHPRITSGTIGARARR
jgi:hypothetical protein